MHKVCIFTESTNQRKNYIYDFFIQKHLRADYVITSSIEDFNNSDCIRIAHSNNSQLLNLDNIIYIRDSLLLIENCIPTKKDFIVHFPPEALKKVDFSQFDVFAFAFYILTMFDEYNQPAYDKHNRVTYANSLLKEYNTKHPLVDYVFTLLKNEIQKKFNNVDFVRKNNINIFLTFDIDIAYYYRAKPFYRNIGAWTKDIITLNLSSLKKRYLVLTDKIKDPYDVYENLKAQLNSLLDGKNIKIIFFFLVRSYGKHDKAISHKSKDFVNLVKYISSFAEVGIHPSYKNGQDHKKIITEKQILEEILNQKIIHSRQHFLKLQIPHTVEQLELAGIEHDYSLAYADNLVFRAGTCHSFNLYNLKTEKTSICLHPLTYMDGTLKDYLNLTPQEAINEITELFNIVKLYNGEFISLWHNESLSETGRWQNWKTQVFEQMLLIIQQTASNHSSVKFF